MFDVFKNSGRVVSNSRPVWVRVGGRVLGDWEATTHPTIYQVWSGQRCAAAEFLGALYYC